MAENTALAEWTDEGAAPAQTAEDKAEEKYQRSVEAERRKLGLLGEQRDALHPAELVPHPLEAKHADDTGMGTPLVDDSTNAANEDLSLTDPLVKEHTRPELDRIAAKEGVDTTGAKTKADVADAIHAAEAPRPADDVTMPDTEAMSRAQLDKVARGYGLDPKDYRNKTDLRAAIQKAHFEAQA